MVVSILLTTDRGLTLANLNESPMTIAEGFYCRTAQARQFFRDPRRGSDNAAGWARAAALRRSMLDARCLWALQAPRCTQPLDFHLDSSTDGYECQGGRTPNYCAASKGVVVLLLYQDSWLPRCF